MIKKILSACLCLLLSFSFVSCDAGYKNYKKEIFDCFDTVSIVSGYFKSEQEFNECFDKIEKKLKFYHKLFDIYNNYDKMNNIKTVNDNAGLSPVLVDDELIELLDFSKKAYELTDGKVNVCIGSVTKIWKNSQKTKTLPSKEKLVKANKTTDINNLVINRDKGTVFLKQKGCLLDVGAITKGFVCEKLKNFARQNGLENGIINLGGNVMTIGEKQDKSHFKIGIKNPDNPSENIFVVNVKENNVVTSGNYERYFEKDGVRYCHIVSPETLMPADKNKSVTIIADNASLADALSTCLFIADYKDGISLINSLENCEALIIDENGATHFSKEFKKYFEK